ncbi:MAG: CBS domain-containing protein [Rhodobacteraceae bacterium]|nr:CBS domain-containing protein [Paracoccaceae bacterium]
MTVSQILRSKGTAGVSTIRPGASVASAVEMLSSLRIGALVVSSDGAHPQGIISERDVVRELGRRGGAVLNEKVSDLMTGNVVTCSPSDRADSVLERMTEGRFRHMPVVQDGGMVGLISIGDVVKARLAELAMEKQALEGMIMGN